MRSFRQAAVLLIGNELLSGRVQDQNLAFLAQQLWSIGIRVTRAEVVRDDVLEIADRVAALAATHDFLFTSGGIGPTHDDVTIAGVARAFGVPVVEDDVLAARIREHFGDGTTEAHLRMAAAPANAVLVGAPPAWPTIRAGNTFVLPGVPAILRRKFLALKPSLDEGTGFHRASLVLRVQEVDIAPVLDRVAAEFADLEIGSYPEPDLVLVTIEGGDAGRVALARERLDALTDGFSR